MRSQPADVRRGLQLAAGRAGGWLRRLMFDLAAGRVVNVRVESNNANFAVEKSYETFLVLQVLPNHHVLTFKFTALGKLFESVLILLCNL